MDTWAYFSLKLLHIFAMAVYLGSTVAAPIGMRRALRLGPAHGHDFMVRLQQTTRMIVAMAFLTFASGAALVWLRTWSGTPGRYLWGAALLIALFVIGGGFSRPVFNALLAHFARGGDAASAEPLERRFYRLIRVEQALRLTALALMVLPV
jgi:uncharacterized membrane protein